MSVLHRLTGRRRVKTASFSAVPEQMRPRPDAGPIEREYFQHDGALIHKWHHYLPLYDRYFAPYRGRLVRMLEIGVAKGGSLELWRRYFGPRAVIFGIDVNPDCAMFDKVNGNHVRIGSQADAAFLEGVVEEMGGADIVLDDGSHVTSHMRASFDVLFPLLSSSGIYVAEDTHTNYWTKYKGGYRRRSSFIECTKTLIDDMHHWWHDRGQRIEAGRDTVSGVHFHDSIIVIEKQKTERPVNSKVGVARF